MGFPSTKKTKPKQQLINKLRTQQKNTHKKQTNSACVAILRRKVATRPSTRKKNKNKNKTKTLTSPQV